jgi:hypothetical protein
MQIVKGLEIGNCQINYLFNYNETDFVTSHEEVSWLLTLRQDITL